MPQGPGPWRVLLFLHGNHQTCIDAEGQEFVPPQTDPTCPDWTAPLQTRIRSYAGYDYLADLLVSHGYAVQPGTRWPSA